MIREVAIAPEVLPDWIRSGNVPFILNQINQDTGNFFSRFPRSWKRRVHDLLTGSSDIEKTRLSALLQRLWESGVDRSPTCGEPCLDWLTHTLNDHARVPFDIIVTDGVHDHPCAVNGSDPKALFNYAWPRQTSVRVKRSVSDLSQAVLPLLFRSNQIDFVDVNFSTERRFTELLRRFIECSLINRPKAAETCEYRYHAGYRFSSRHDFNSSVHDDKKSRFERELPQYLPEGVRLTVYFWEEQARNMFHNRYILTNIGGVNFSSGLDTVLEENHDSHDDLSLMSSKQYSENRLKFASKSSPGLKFHGEITVVGTRPRITPS